jgi:two-component system nitrate/nitrite sensor histidine kinase NarX
MPEKEPTELYPEPRFWSAWFIRLGEDTRITSNRGRLQILLLFLLLTTLLAIIIIAAAGQSLHLKLFEFEVSVASIGLLAVITVGLLIWSIWSVLLDPLLRICNWADLMRGVNLDAKVTFDSKSDFIELSSDINMLSNMIDQLSRDTEVQLQEHTDYISRESLSLTVLYEVTSNINAYRDLKELFAVSIESLCVNLNAIAGIVRNFKTKNKEEIVTSYGNLNHTFLANIDRLLPQPGNTTGPGRPEITYRIDSLPDSTAFTRSDNNIRNDLIALTVYVGYRKESLGVIHLFFPEDMEHTLDDHKELLLSIGQHLGTAIEKHRLDEEETQLLVMRERNRLSHELHDSLAQTLASIRIQIRVMDEIVLTSDEQSIGHQMERLEYSIDEANNQLRELIDNFSIPMHQGGLVSSIEESIQLTKKESGISVYFQNEWPEQDLSADEEHNILRIIQESLANIRKHSQANVVRILFSQKAGMNHVLIEDDGIGFDESRIKPDKGKQIGLGILRDRAAQIEGNISIESEIGDGTRIRLQFRMSSNN